MYLYPGGGLSILTDRDQRSWVFLNDPKKYFGTDSRPKNILSKEQDPKNTLVRHDYDMIIKKNCAH